MYRLNERRNNIIGAALFAAPIITLTIFLMGDDNTLTEDSITCTNQMVAEYYDNNYTWGREPETIHNYFKGVECLDKGGLPCKDDIYYYSIPSIQDMIVTIPNIKRRSESCTNITKVSEPNVVTLVALGILLISLIRRLK